MHIEPGYYWVKIQDINDWVIVRIDTVGNVWIIGSDVPFSIYDITKLGPEIKLLEID